MRLHSSFFSYCKIRLQEAFYGTAFWFILICSSYVIGFSFQQAITLFAEASRSAQGSPGLLAGINPYDGIFVPTLGSFYLIQTLIFPFLTVGLFAKEKESGAKKLNYLLPSFHLEEILSHGFVFLTLWMIVFLISLLSLIIWHFNGGHIYYPEVLNLILGHFLYAVVIFSISKFAATITESGANAAIIVLGFTLGSWVLDFMAPAQTGWLKEITSLSLTAQIRSFESGLLDWGVVLRMALLSAGFISASIYFSKSWMKFSKRLLIGFSILIFCAITFTVVPRQKYSYDMTEDRRNSFDLPSEKALQGLSEILKIEIGLSPDDSRFKDFNRSILQPLLRSVPHLQYGFQYQNVALDSFKNEGKDNYGIIYYIYKEKRDQSRSTSPEEVLPIIFNLADVKVDSSIEIPYRGYPLVMSSIFAEFIFYVFLPILSILGLSYFKKNKIMEVFGYD